MPAAAHPLVAHHSLQIKSCDAILAHMEELLGSFQCDLGKVSDEIRALQVRWPAVGKCGSVPTHSTPLPLRVKHTRMYSCVLEHTLICTHAFHADTHFMRTQHARSSTVDAPQLAHATRQSASLLPISPPTPIQSHCPPPQVQSQTMSTKVKNRRTAEDRLGRFVEALAVSEEIVAGIMDADVGEDYLEHLLSLDRKLSYLNSDELAAGSQARRDVEPVLERLRMRAITKVGRTVLAVSLRLCGAVAGFAGGCRGERLQFRAAAGAGVRWRAWPGGWRRRC